MKKLITSICLLLVAATLLGTSTFAWFSMNNTVQAKGLQIKAKSDSTALLISSSKTTAAEIQTENVTTAAITVSGDEASVYPCAPVRNDTEVAYFASKTPKAEKVTNGAKAAVPTNWYTANAEKTSASTIKSGTASQLTASNFDDYVIAKKVYLTVAKGANMADTLTVSATFTQLDTNKTDSSARVLVYTSQGGFAILTPSACTNVDIKGSDAGITDATVVTVDILVYVDGTDTSVYTGNIANLTGLAIDLDFGVSSVNSDAKNTLNSIEVKGNYVKSYALGAALDTTGLLVQANYAYAPYTADVTSKCSFCAEENGTYVTAAEFHVEGTTPKIQTIYVKYQNKVKSFNVAVGRAVDSIALTDKSATEKYNKLYRAGEALDTNNLVVTATYNIGTVNDADDKTKVVTDDCTASVAGGYTNNLQAGTQQTVTVSYTEDGVTKTNTYKIDVYALKNITVSGPTKKEYNLGDDLDLAGLVVNAIYSETSTDDAYKLNTTLNSSEYTVSGYDKNTNGEQTVTVTYNANTAIKATFKVNVTAKIS